MNTERADITQEEIQSLLEMVFQQYGFDFRDYSPAHIKRRIQNRMALSGIRHVNQLNSEIRDSKLFAELFLKDLSINVTEMYRDPAFYEALREHVIPRLRTYSFFKIWHAGCSTGEEVYSMAILLKEEGLYDRALIYATDFNQEVLHQAKEGIYPDEMIRDYTQQYQQAGGKSSLSDYYTSKYEHVIMDQSLKKNIVWANHNLATDHVFAEVNLILCRNVLIYFNRDLQNRVHKIFLESLANGGFLCLGNRESIKHIDVQDEYLEADKKNKIYIRKY